MTTNVVMIRDRLVEIADALFARYHPFDVAAMSTVDQKHLVDVVDALCRLEAGTYGICIGCGGSLGIERLLEQPEASMCDGCALEDSWRPFGPT